MKLVIGNKNYSTWSLRPWLLLKHAGIPFEEEVISFNAADFRARVSRYSPSGKVPVLIDGGLTVWDSLAIAEYVAERFPGKQLWPADVEARAVARSLCAEMHSGFAELRSTLTMNFSARFSGGLWRLGVQKEIARIIAAWDDARGRFGADGPFLFGAFSVADAFFAPVAQRFVGYDVKLPEGARRYVDTIQGLPAMKAWAEAARCENDFVPPDEPYRAGP
jgi:glutathione S-transferase